MAISLSEFSVYTIVHADELKRLYESGGTGTIEEKKKWVSGLQLFHDARAAGLQMPVIFGDAAWTSDLLYYGFLTSVEILGETLRGPTRYSFDGLTPVDPPVPKSALRLMKDGRPLSDDHIRPYVLVHTPSFVRAPSESMPEPQGSRLSRLLDAVLPSALKPKPQMGQIYLFGYSGKSDAQIERAIGENGLLLDIRYSPRSMRTGYSRAGLIRTFGDRYRHVRELGNADYKSGGIRLADPDAGLSLVEELAATHPGPLFLMCSCEDGDTCHRKLVGELLRQRNYTVEEYSF